MRGEVLTFRNVRLVFVFGLVLFPIASRSVGRGVVFARELGALLFELAQFPVLGKQLLGLQRHPALLLLKFVQQ